MTKLLDSFSIEGTLLLILILIALLLILSYMTLRFYHEGISCDCIFMLRHVFHQIIRGDKPVHTAISTLERNRQYTYFPRRNQDRINYVWNEAAFAGRRHSQTKLSIRTKSRRHSLNNNLLFSYDPETKNYRYSCTGVNGSLNKFPSKILGAPNDNNMYNIEKKLNGSSWGEHFTYVGNTVYPNSSTFIPTSGQNFLGQFYSLDMEELIDCYDYLVGSDVSRVRS